MKRILTSLSLVMLLSMAVRAVDYTDITISKTQNTLTLARPALSSLLPDGFLTTIFDGSGNPTMDRLYIFMNIPSGFTAYTITDPTAICSKDGGGQFVVTNPSITLTAGKDILLSYSKDGNKYRLNQLPFDPTTRALEPQTIADGERLKVYTTGQISSRLSTELPEQIKIYLPSYLECMRDYLNALLVDKVYNVMRVNQGLENFSFNPNTEGFFYFTGGRASILDLYTDNLSIRTQSKENDFLGGMVGDLLDLNLYSLEGSEATQPTDAEIQEWIDNSYFDMNMTEEVVRTLSTAQIKRFSNDLSFSMISWLTPGQVLSLLELSDYAAYLQTPAATINTKLHTIFNDTDKETEAIGVLTNLDSKMLEEVNGVPVSSLVTAMLTSGFDRLFSSMVQGSASPFAFSSNSEDTEGNAFNIRVHSKGENTITGGAKATFKNVGEEMSKIAQLQGRDDVIKMVDDLATMFTAMIHFTSAPFAVRPSAKVVSMGSSDKYTYTCTRFTFDDEGLNNGTTTHTNGLMNMPVVGDEIDAPSIDLGTPNGQAIFNAGRYRFHTPVSNKNINMFYVATMAICYRELAVTMPNPLSSGTGWDITYSGVGTSIGYGPAQNRADTYRNVIINDGTFCTYSAEQWKDNNRGVYAVDAIANGWYKHYTDLRMPYNTSVLGGTFPEETYVYRCDAAAEQGVRPVYIYIANPSDPTSPQWNTPLCERKELVASLDLANPSDLTNSNGTVKVLPAKRQMLQVKTGASSTANIEYGTSSITADANGKVFVYVTGDCVVERNYTRNYVTALAPFGEKHLQAVMLSMGGDVEVKSLYQDRAGFPLKNAYMLYTQLGYYTFLNAGVNLGGLYRTLQDEFQIDRAQHHNFKTTGTSTNSSGQGIMTTTDKTGVVFSEVTNDNQYRIEYGIYSMLPIMSNQWMMLSMPYDVANIYVLETIDEQPKSYNTWTETEYDAYFKRQGAADGNMAQTLVTSVLPDIFSGRGSGVLQPLPYILNNMTNYKTQLTKLEHYNGTNIKTAHFYLNQMVPDQGTNQWTKEDNEINYGKKWTPAPASVAPTYLTSTITDPDCTDWYDCEDITLEEKYVNQDGEERPASEQKIIMKKGQVYVLYFPGGTNRWYDHKYIVIEGYGPQRLDGKDQHSSFAHPAPSSAFYPGDGYLTMQGNTTFGNYSMTGVSASHPVFYPLRETGGAFPGGWVNYSFESNSNATQRILPTSVYMVTDNNQSTKALMPALHNDNNQTTDLRDNPNLPTLEQLSLEAWTNNGIYLRALQEQHIEIYSTTGTLLWHGTVQAGTTTFVPADKGMYIIRGEERTVKVVN